MMKIYDDNDMDAPGMELARAGLDAFVEELKTPELSKVRWRSINAGYCTEGNDSDIFVNGQSQG